MKTAMQELIEIYEYYHSFEEFNEWFMDMGKKAMLEKEKQLACQFAKEYINGASYDNLQDYYDEKFLTQPNL